MAKRVRIEYKIGKCIGNGSCAAIAPHYFELRGKKARLLGSKGNNDIFSVERELSNKGAEAVVDAGIACPVNAIRVFDLAKKKDIVSFELDERNARKVIAKYDDAKDFRLDGNKYFLIRLNRKSNNIEVGFCIGKNNLALKVIGKKPVDIYYTILNREKSKVSAEHAAYLGKELEKAYIALLNNIEYVQDGELDFKKKHSGG